MFLVRSWILSAMIVCALVSSAQAAEGAGTHVGEDLPLDNPNPVHQVQTVSDEELDGVEHLMELEFHIPKRYFRDAKYRQRFQEALIKYRAGDVAPTAEILGEFFTTLDFEALKGIIAHASELKAKATKPMVKSMAELLLMGAKVARPRLDSLKDIAMDANFQKFATPFTDAFHRMKARSQTAFYDLLNRYDKNPNEVRAEFLKGDKFDREVLFSFLVHLKDNALQNKLAKALSFKDASGQYYLELMKGNDRKRFFLGSDANNLYRRLNDLRTTEGVGNALGAGYTLAEGAHPTNSDVQVVAADLALDGPAPSALPNGGTHVGSGGPLTPPRLEPQQPSTLPGPVPSQPKLTDEQARAGLNFLRGKLSGLTMPTLPTLPKLPSLSGVLDRLKPQTPPNAGNGTTGGSALPPPRELPPASLPTALDPATKELARKTLQESCFRCHGQGKSGGIANILDGAALQNHVKNGVKRPLIDPAHPEQGILFGRLTDKEDPMPPSGEGEMLNAQQLDAVKKWIAAGAPAFTDPSKEPIAPPRRDTGSTGSTGQPPTGSTGSTGQPPTGSTGSTGQLPTGGTGSTGQPPKGGTGSTGQPPTGSTGSTGTAPAPLPHDSGTGSTKTDKPVVPVRPNLSPGPLGSTGALPPPRIEVIPGEPKPSTGPKVEELRPPQVTESHDAPPPTGSTGSVPPLPSGLRPSGPQPLGGTGIPPGLPTGERHDGATGPTAGAKGGAPIKPNLSPGPLGPVQVQVPAPVLPDPTKMKTEELAGHAKGILEKDCKGCHNSESPTNLKGILDRNLLVSGGHVDPGNPEGSSLFARMTGASDNRKMPPAIAPNQPSAHDISVIREWIKRGAPNWKKGEPPATPPLGKGKVPNDVVGRVAADIEELKKKLATGDEKKKDDWKFVRYFSLKHLMNDLEHDRYPQGQRDALLRMINMLSTGSSAVTPVKVGPDELLYRVDMRDLGWNADSWKALKKEDPFFKDKQPSDDLTLAQNWLVRGDWFVDSAWQGDIYKKLLGIPEKESDLESKLKVTRGSDIERGIAKRAGMRSGGPDGSQLLVERVDQEHGRSYWRGYNFGPNAVGDANLFARPLAGTKDAKPLDYVSSDIVYELPNGLHAFATYGKDGKLIRAGIREATWFGPDGLKNIKDEVREGAEISDAEKPLAQSLYPTQAEMDALVRRDNDRHGATLNAAAKVAPGKPNPLTTTRRDFKADVSLTDMALELGIPPSEITKRLSEPKLAEVKRELAPALRGGKVKRDTFDKAFMHLSAPGNAGAWPPSPNPPTPEPPKPVPQPQPEPPKPPAFLHVMSSTAFETGQPIFYVKLGTSDTFYRIDWNGRGWEVWQMASDPRTAGGRGITITPVSNPPAGLIDWMNKKFLSK